jgi:glutamate mutase epsilon subunit
MINISDKNWDKEDDLTVYMLFDEFIYTKIEDLFKQYYKDKEFCDCQGNVFKVVDRRLPVSFWRSFFRFLPNVYKVELSFIQESKKVTLDELRTFLLERLDEINTNDFVPKWIDSVKKANSYKELLVSEIK